MEMETTKTHEDRSITYRHDSSTRKGFGADPVYARSEMLESEHLSPSGYHDPIPVVGRER